MSSFLIPCLFYRLTILTSSHHRLWPILSSLKLLKIYPCLSINSCLCEVCATLGQSTVGGLLPLVQSHLALQQPLAPCKKHSKHTPCTFPGSTTLFFMLNNISLINHLNKSRSAIKIMTTNAKGLILFLYYRSLKKLIYFCRNLCMTKSLFGLYLSLSSTPFSSVPQIQQQLSKITIPFCMSCRVRL